MQRYASAGYALERELTEVGKFSQVRKEMKGEREFLGKYGEARGSKELRATVSMENNSVWRRATVSHHRQEVLTEVIEFGAGTTEVSEL